MFCFTLQLRDDSNNTRRQTQYHVSQGKVVQSQTVTAETQCRQIVAGLVKDFEDFVSKVWVFWGGGFLLKHKLKLLA